MSEKKLAIKLSTLEGIGNAVREKEGSTDLIPVNALADRIGALQIASGENKLIPFIEGTSTEITAEDLEGATKVREYAFYNMSSLEVITLPDTITVIGQYAFSGSSQTRINKIANLVLPNSVIRIDDYVCSSCVYLQNITFSQNAQFTIIPSNSFNTCNILDNVVIPNNVLEIGNSAFSYCVKLANITLSNNLTKIGSQAFRNCAKLTQLTLPASLTSIGANALRCGAAASEVTFTFLGTTPPTIDSNTFYTLTLNKIIVPAGSGEAYKSATNWANFADYIEEAAV